MATKKNCYLVKCFLRSFNISMDKHVPKHLDLNPCCYEVVGLKKTKIKLNDELNI